MIVVDEAPSKDGILQGRTFAGSAGVLLRRVFAAVPLDERELHMTSALLCQPKRGMEPKDWNAAVAACRPRLERELAAISDTVPAVLYGGRALQAFVGSDKVFDHLGVAETATLIEPARQVLPSLHPTHALPHKAPAYKNVIDIHTRRAWKLAQGKPSVWTWPEIVTDEDGDEAILAAVVKLSLATELGVDVETPRIGDPRDFPALAKILLNIGIANADPKAPLALCVTWPETSERVRSAILGLLRGPAVKVMHNGSFDMMVFHYNEIEVANFSYDTMIAWQIVAPKLKAGLDFVACALTSAPRWKNEFRQHGKKIEADADPKIIFDSFLHADKRERAIYCAKDSYLQAFLRRAQKYYFDEDQTRIFEQRMRLTHIGLKMRQAGVLIDEEMRDGFRRPYRARMLWALRRLRKIAKRLKFSRVKEKKKVVWDYQIVETVTKKGKVKTKRIKVPDTRRQEVVESKPVPFNPGNIHHIRELFQKHLGVAGGPPKIEGRDERFDANVMRDFTKNSRAEVRELAVEILNFRKNEKVLSTFIDGLPVYPDGKIHIEWKPGQTATLRWASANPNGQNIPGKLRSMFRAAAGFYLVEMDYSQLELRIMALVSRDLPLIAAYAAGIDVHAANAEVIFGAEWAAASPGERKGMRTFAKRFVFGANYNAIARTLWESLVVEFPNLRFSVVAKALESWFRAHPDIKKWQHATIAEAYRVGYASEAILSKHKNHFFGAIDPSIAVNFPIQTFGAHLANAMMEDVAAEIDWTDGESILFMIHDSVVLQVRDPVAWVGRLQKIAEKEVTVDGLMMKFPIDIKVSGRNMQIAVELDKNGEFAVPLGTDRWQRRKRLLAELEKASLL